MSNVNVYKSKTPAMANRTILHRCLAVVGYVIAHKPCILLERTHRRGQQLSQTLEPESLPLHVPQLSMVLRNRGASTRAVAY